MDLKDKIDKNLQLDLNIRESNPIVGQNPKLDDALNALEALGFTHKSVEKIQSKLAALDESTTTDQYISNGLKMLTK